MAEGLTKRQEFVKAAMQGVLSNAHTSSFNKEGHMGDEASMEAIARLAVEVGDKTLEVMKEKEA